MRDGHRREVFIYQVSDHEAAYAEVGSQAISYTAGVPPVAAARLIVSGEWDAGRMVNVEELDPVPFIGLLDQMGLPTETLELDPDAPNRFDGTVRDLATEIEGSVAHVAVSAADPMRAVRPCDPGRSA